MVESGKMTLLSQFVQLPDTPTNFHRPSTSRSTKLQSTELHHLTPLKRADPDRLRQSRIYGIYEWVFSKISGFPLQLPPMSKDLVGISNKSMRHEFLLNIKFH